MAPEGIADADALLGRIRGLIDTVGGVSASARHVGVARNTVDQWYKGAARIPLAATIDLARHAKLDLNELLGGSPIPTDDGGGALREASPSVGFVGVPMLRLSASAGSGKISQGEPERGDVISFREDWFRRLGLVPGRAEAMTAVGDSMEPTIRDGDLLLVDRTIDRVVNHGIYVVVYNGAVLVKRVQLRLDGSLVLKSDNGVYSEEVVPSNDAAELIIEGRVRWFGRMI